MKPPVAATVEAIRQAVAEARRRGLTVGLVPTMGALHEGHLSLCRAARSETGFVVATIFVNPTQFGPNEDFTRYPRQLAADLELCGQAGVDVVFAPEVATMYPPDFRTSVEVLGLADGLCGAARPGHFRGVTTVVLKLFNIVGADVAYFGQKDAQQARLIRQMVHDLNVPLQVRVCPIVREADGLALSSRNQYLDPTQRRHAVALHQALQAGQREIEAGQRDAEAIRQLLVRRIETTPGAVLGYAAVVDADTLQPLAKLQGEVLLALAVKFGATRLIDNLLVQVRDEPRPMN
jgi:pantoate--beta-alanine ligase